MSTFKKDVDTINKWIAENSKQFIATRNRFDLENDIMKVWSTAEDIKTLTGMYFDSRETMTPDELWNKLDAIQNMHDMHMKQLWDTYLQAFELDGYYDPTKQDTKPVSSNTKPKAKAKPKKAKSSS